LALVASSARVYLAFGSFAWNALWSILTDEWELGRRTPFSHGARLDHPRGTLLASYHPSQQNTFTGTLTNEMLDEVLALASTLAKSEKPPTSR
jgi:uracil-DNA glycosylase